MSFGRLKSSAPSITGFTLCLDWGAAVTWTAVLHLVAGAARCLYKELKTEAWPRHERWLRVRGSPPRAEGGTLMLTRRSLLAVSAACLFGAGDAAAQDWPQPRVRMIVPFGPGGGADIIGRIVAQSLQEKLGQPVVIENRPGAGGTLGNEAVARADKDGYTLGIMTAGQIIAAVMSKSLRYDTLPAFDPVSQVATAGLIIVTRPDFPADDVKQLVAAAKANPGKISFASP